MGGGSAEGVCPAVDRGAWDCGVPAGRAVPGRRMRAVFRVRRTVRRGGGGRVGAAGARCAFPARQPNSGAGERSAGWSFAAVPGARPVDPARHWLGAVSAVPRTAGGDAGVGRGTSGTAPADRAGAGRHRVDWIHAGGGGTGSRAVRAAAVLVADFFAGDGGGLGAPVFADDHGLIGEKAAAAAAVVGLRNHSHRIPPWGTLHLEEEAGLFAFAEFAGYEVGGGWAGLAAGRGAELLEGHRVLAELALVLRLRGMNGAGHAEGRKLIGLHSGVVVLWNRDGQDDEDDRDDDHQLHESEAAAGDLTVDRKLGRNHS